jgi:hypothetical protein
MQERMLSLLSCCGAHFTPLQGSTIERGHMLCRALLHSSTGKRGVSLTPKIAPPWALQMQQSALPSWCALPSRLARVLRSALPAHCANAPRQGIMLSLDLCTRFVHPTAHLSRPASSASAHAAQWCGLSRTFKAPNSAWAHAATSFAVPFWLPNLAPNQPRPLSRPHTGTCSASTAPPLSASSALIRGGHSHSSRSAVLLRLRLSCGN